MHGAVDGPAEFSKIVEQLKTNPSPDAPESEAEKVVTYDEMILNLLLKVHEDVREKGLDKNDERLRESLIQGLKSHIVKLGEVQEKHKTELEAEEKEKAKKITSEALHDGWDSHVRLAIYAGEILLTVSSIYPLNLTQRQSPKLPSSQRQRRRQQRRQQHMKFSTRRRWILLPRAP